MNRSTPIPDGEAAIRWFDGAAAWQAAAHFERVDEARIRCEFPISRHWELTSARLSKRVRVGQSQLLVRIVSSSALPGANANEVCFRFTPAKLTRAARIRTWHQAWTRRELDSDR